MNKQHKSTVRKHRQNKQHIQKQNVQTNRHTHNTRGQEQTQNTKTKHKNNSNNKQQQPITQTNQHTK